MRNKFRSALALALELDDGLALALALNRHCLRTIHKSMGAALSFLLFSKQIYIVNSFALAVAHSAIGVYEMRRAIETALALALELDKRLALALALNKHCLRTIPNFMGAGM